MQQTPVQWVGLNHLALITDDMDTTTRFWHGVLGATLVATIGNERFRHYFFDVACVHGRLPAFSLGLARGSASSGAGRPHVQRAGKRHMPRGMLGGRPG